jgi:hypothetical protein
LQIFFRKYAKIFYTILFNWLIVFRKILSLIFLAKLLNSALLASCKCRQPYQERGMGGGKRGGRCRVHHLVSIVPSSPQGRVVASCSLPLEQTDRKIDLNLFSA